MRRFSWRLVLLCSLTACGGSKGGGSNEPPVTPNEAPVLLVPTALSGGPVQFSLQLPVASSQTLVFNATDADGDALLWQIGVAANAQIAAGLSFVSPVAGSSFTLELQPVTVPAAAELSVLVEDTRGSAAAIDLKIVRSGPPTITSVVPNSAFASAGQPVTITGTAFSLANSVSTTASFNAVIVGQINVVDDTTLTGTTPQAGLPGPRAVAVSNLFGSASLPPGAFTMYAYPVDLFPADMLLDGGSGADLAAARDGDNIQLAWVEGGALVHRGSTDGGATFSGSQFLSGGEVPSDPQIVVRGANVTVVWLGDGSTVLTRSSADGGQSFAATRTLNPLAGGAPAVLPQLVASGNRRYCAWLAGNPGLGLQRVTVSSSADAGGIWTAPRRVNEGGANQSEYTLGCAGALAWVAYLDNPVGGAPAPGVYTSRTTDGGLLWTAGVRRSTVSSSISALRSCNDGLRAYLVWVRNGALEFLKSGDGGTTWPTQATQLRAADLGTITEPDVACERDRLFAAYVAGGNNLAFSRVGAAGAAPEHVTVSDVVEVVGRPSLRTRGNYAFVAFRGGDVAAGNARIRFASSTDIGLTFTAPTLFGNGTAAQSEPDLLIDSARVWIGWQDARVATPGLYANRTEQ